ncbi:hypothetical protein MtrunA17_Chr8g0358611 [Medicago truncatula]|uniref:Uncharacterized protein n=1 Tax=Medicago truncatula TaxID=3880 RepID=A0A396GMJ6_MEDTR|nr:hypothetical protein MtrunA17_Chr8g0358611 [Medicago truncatula]
MEHKNLQLAAVVKLSFALVAVDMIYCDFKAAANLNITNMQTLGFYEG